MNEEHSAGSSCAFRIHDESADFEHSREIMERLWSTAKVGFRRDREFRSQIDTIVMPQVNFGANATVGGLTIREMILEDSWLLTIPIQGQSMHVVKGRTHLASGSNAILHPLDRSLEIRTVSDVQSLQVNIDAKSVESAIALYQGKDVERIESPFVDIDMASEAARKAKTLSDHCLRYFSKTGPTPVSSALSLRIFERRWIQVFVEWFCEPVTYRDRLFDSGLIYVSRAEEYIRANLEQPLSLTELSQHCGVSGRALLLGFRKLRGTSPMNFWRSLRLEAAHRELLSTDISMSVTEIAMKLGFTHLGRFASDYRKRYHETPSETRSRSFSNVSRSR